MTPQEVIRRGQKAETLRNDETLSAAWKAVEEQLLAELIGSDVSERDKRDDVYRCLRLLAKLQEVMIGYVRSGRIEVKQIAALEKERTITQRMLGR